MSSPQPGDERGSDERWASTRSRPSRPSSPTPSAQALIASGQEEHGRHFRPRRRSTLRSVQTESSTELEPGEDRRRPRKSAIDAIRDAAEGIKRDMKGIAQQLKLAAPETPIEDVVPKQEMRLRPAVSGLKDEIGAFYLNETFFRPEERHFDLVSRGNTGQSSESVLVENKDFLRQDDDVGPFRNPAHRGAEEDREEGECLEASSDGEKVLLQSWLLIKNKARPKPFFLKWISRFFILVDGALVCLSETGGEIWRLRLAGARVREPVNDLERVDPTHFIVDFRDVHSALPAVPPFDEIGTSIHLRASMLELKHTWMSFLNAQSERHSRFLQVRAEQGVFVRIVNPRRDSMALSRRPLPTSGSSSFEVPEPIPEERTVQALQRESIGQDSHAEKYALEAAESAFSKYLYLRLMQSSLAKAKEYVESRGYPEHLIEPLAEELGRIQAQVIAEHQVKSMDDLNQLTTSAAEGDLWHGSGNIHDILLGLKLIAKSRRNHRRMPTEMSLRTSDAKPARGTRCRGLCDQISTLLISRHSIYSPSASPPQSPTASWSLRRSSSPSKTALKAWRAEIQALESKPEPEEKSDMRVLANRKLARPLALGDAKEELAGAGPGLTLGSDEEEYGELLSISDLGFGFSLTADLQTDQDIMRRLCAQNVRRHRQEEKMKRCKKM